MSHMDPLLKEADRRRAATSMKLTAEEACLLFRVSWGLPVHPDEQGRLRNARRKLCVIRDGGGQADG